MIIKENTFLQNPLRTFKNHFYKIITFQENNFSRNKVHVQEEEDIKNNFK